MSALVDYLKSAKRTFIENLNSSLDVHIVIGNESCDLDSTVSSLVLAFFLDKYKIPQIPNSAIIIPILNVTYENFLLRTENCFVLQECEIPLTSLIYRNEVNIEELLKTKRITASLVDHHVLSKNDCLVESRVVEIFDHRPFDVNSKWKNQNIKLRIEEVGSCSTLIADEILRRDESFLTKDLAYMIYETIIYDTIALRPENGRAKELDVSIAKKLEDKFCFKEGRGIIYNKLWAAHNDVSHLSPRQILLKDLKIVENIPVPGLPMLVQNFFKITDAYNAVENMADEYEVSLVILIGLDASEEVKRDVAIFWRDDGIELKNMLLTTLTNSEELKGYNFCFQEINTGCTNVVCLRQNNVKLSRKQIIPLIKYALLKNGN
ncbi:exopolyphosphatase PRUNE1 [Anoplophora glabripennis]|uniref:exopolyphosphatase PRUNE1 n=1 Tax=Anoplophora glabripennis TaxID=217634 RepID=UPI000874262C|nr:exopolyphosphatase PRUNE1 [Anoplophora glabripennis]